MTTDFRALCAELLAELENAIRVIYREDGTRHISGADPVITKTDAALAQPDPEGELTDEKLRKLWCSGWDTSEEWGAFKFARAVEAAVIARRPAPAPPGEGEVADLIAVLSADAECVAAEQPDLMQITDQQLTRAAELLQRQHPQPVPVSERPWERDGWCDEQGRCWWFNRAGIPEWQLSDDGLYGEACLPYNALPLPS